MRNRWYLIEWDISSTNWHGPFEKKGDAIEAAKDYNFPDGMGVELVKLKGTLLIGVYPNTSGERGLLR